MKPFPRFPTAPDLSVAVKELSELAKVGRAGPKAWPNSDVYEEIKKAFENFRSTLSKLKVDGFTPPPSELETAILVGQRLVRVVREVQRTYADRKRYLGVVDFQDLVMLTRDLLSQRADIRARLQDRYRFVLLDEMQDTDPVQGELLDLLCGPRKNEGKLFAVGDANQSIYRFRGADVSLFQSLRQAVAHTGRLGLSVNFRSQPAILDFANALVGHRLADYEPLRAHHPQLNPNPCVEFLWAPREDKESVTSARMEEARWIARRLAAMIGRESLVVEREQGKADVLRLVQAGDIVLLFRAMSNVALYEAALRDAGLDYYLVGGRAFFAQQEIYDLLNLLRALENPQDSVSLAGTLRSPFCCLSDESLYILARHPGGLWAGLNDPTLEPRLPQDQRATVARARHHLQRWRQGKDRLPIARLLGAMFADSGFDAATQLEYLADRKLANLWKLQDLARTFDRSGLFGLADFIVRLNEMVKSQAREEQAATQPEKADVIKLMSIHQAKGLEFPVVVIPDFAASTRGDSLPIAHWERNLGCVVRPPNDEEEPGFADFGYRLWQAQNEVEQWQEDQRILYVACTRAKDYLILSSSLSEGTRASNSWMLTLQERFDIQTGQCLAADLEEGHVPRVRVFDSLSPPPADRALTTSTAAHNVLREHLDPEPARRVVPPQLDNFKVLEVADLFPLRATRGREETLLRMLLANCGGPEPERWRGLLVALTEDWAPAQRAGLEMIIPRIIALDVVQQFLATETRQHQVDYWLHLPTKDPAAWTTPHLVVHGRIDGLWQDGTGAWHLLTWSWRPERLPDAQDAWEAETKTVTLAATALRQQLGAWPTHVHLVVLPFGLVVTKPGRYLPQRHVMADLLAQLG